MENYIINNGIITNVKTVILFRKNLSNSNKGLFFEEINLDHFKYETNGDSSTVEYSQVQEVIMFIDDNGRTKILKNRYGKTGEIK